MTFLVMNPQIFDVARELSFPLSSGQTLGYEIYHRANVLASKVSHRLSVNCVPVVNPDVKYDWYERRETFSLPMTSSSTWNGSSTLALRPERMAAGLSSEGSNLDRRPFPPAHCLLYVDLQIL